LPPDEPPTIIEHTFERRLPHGTISRGGSVHAAAAAGVAEGRPDAASRLELARGLLRRAEGRAQSVQPLDVIGPAAPGTDGRVLPVAAPLARLLPAGGLRRGSALALPPGPAATSRLLALLAECSADGAWVGVVGKPELGLVAAAEAGIRLERLALVPQPGSDLLAVTIALLDGMDVVVVAPGDRALPAGERRKLEARARQRGAVLVALGQWAGADVELSCADSRWHGLGAGAGRLREREVRVRLRGRGVAPGGRWARVLLPATGAVVAPAAAEEAPEESAAVRAVG
jgi:hypothetical protein